MAGILTAFGLGFGYFVAAIPAGVAAGLPVWAAALAAWFGYTCGGAVVLAAGAPFRLWLVQRLKIPVERDPGKLVWKVWNRAGLPGLGLLAPVTVGPQVGAILALAVGEKPLRVLVVLSLGVLPWCALFGVLVWLGKRAL